MGCRRWSQVWLVGVAGALSLAGCGLQPSASAPFGPAGPSKAVAIQEPFIAIAARTTMTADAQGLLAGSDPVLVDKLALGARCPLDSELSVLGCDNDGRIAVLRVTDPRLDGMTETTTAHEVLHAAWASLTDRAKAKLIPLLEAALAANNTPELARRIQAYRDRDPDSVDNELHSIIGTEVADVGPELDTYYQRWFADRSAVVGLAQSAQSTFISLETQVQALDTQLDGLRTRIASDETSLDTQRSALEAQAADLEALRAGHRVSRYNAGVGPYNASVREYNTAVKAHRDLVDQYNALVGQRNGLADSYTSLVDQITTTAQSLPAST